MLQCFVVPDSKVFTLEGQIEHKVNFIHKFVPDDVEVVLIGHSIGAHIILEIMERLHRDRIKQGNYHVYVTSP